MPLLLRQPRRNKALRPFLIAAGVCSFFAYSVSHFFKTEQSPTQGEAVQIADKQKTITRTIVSVSPSQTRQLIDILRLFSIASTRSPTYTITLDSGESNGPRVEHPFDAYSCVLEARIRLNDAIAEGQFFDEAAFLRSRDCPSLSELLQSIKTTPTDESFEALRILVAERSRSFKIRIPGGNSSSPDYSLCELVLEMYSLINTGNPLIVAAELASEHETARTILMEGVLSSQTEPELAFFGFVRTKPADQEQVDARMEFVDAIANAKSLNLGSNPTQSDIELFESGVETKRSALLDGASDETIGSNAWLMQSGLDACTRIGFGRLVGTTTKK